MRIPSSLSSLLLLLSSTLLPSVSASGFDCEHINVNSVKYDLSALGGVHTLYDVEETDKYVVNTTYVLNVCNILKGASIRGHLKCGTSKNICGFRYNTSLTSTEEFSRVFPIVGLEHMGHGSKDPEITRLKTLDSSRDGLLVKLWGGEYDVNGKTKDAGAAIEFECDPDRTGLEGLRTSEDAKRRRDEVSLGAAAGDGDADMERSLQFKGFGPSDQDGDDSYLLKLNWRTRYACENVDGVPGGGDGADRDGESHWGFFTWMIILLFLGIAAYLIFGSWLNYSRYGARGWDLLPHGDTLRDVPYLFQDWLKRVVNTLQGTGSRGGYSAV
ncbi:autophagy protein Atg27 [Aspergillus heteromorphus CBS 117.55]|uniref:Autophagy-related protein 27 n=1 Tax=Aspergillus heteromorphus CBS 117.55 TaxID=1448321 RepID=A0A317WUL3_9EURO|nr:autophagy protein Atg27 [Aspergillus heteromorphus CBS 117.55]PWY90114.1 autophagy protein Atg27 [Aspergillus heteromorphus CBS 117.55]